MQKNNQLPQLTGQNPYNEVYEDFQNNEDLKAYYSEFVEKPFFEENKQLFQISKISGYFFQVFSGLTASTLVYFFIFDMLSIVFVAATMTVGVVLLLEASKRNIAGNVFITYVKYSEPSQRYNKGLIAILALLVALSIAFSFFGAQRIVKEMTNAPTLVVANTTDLKEQIEGIDQQIYTAEQQTNNKGKILYKVIPTLTSLNNQKAVLQQRIFDIENQTAEENATVTATHQTMTAIKAEYFALITFLLEFMFLLTAYYCKYYKYRSLVELSLLNELEFNNYQVAAITEQPKQLSEEETPTLPEAVEEEETDNEPNNEAITILEAQNFNKEAEQLEVNVGDKKALNGTPVNSVLERRAIGFKLHNDNRINENRIDEKSRFCLYCNNAYVYNHKKQKFCSDKCRIANWQERTGKELIKKKRKV